LVGIQRHQGVSVVIENRAGAGTVIGTELVARAVPDGNTILMAAGSFTVNPHIKKLSYDPLTSFEPVCYLVRSPHVLVVPANSPYKTLPQLLAAAKAKPDEIMFAANGPATSQHIEFEMLQKAAKVKMTFVPFTGDAPTLNAALGDQVSVAILDYVTVAEYIKIGKLHAIAVGSQQRIDKLPDTPSMGELGFTDFDWAGTFGILAPAKTPKDKTDELIRWFSASLQAPEVLAKLDNLGLYAMNQCGPEYAAFLRKAYDQNGRVIMESNIKAE
jgi:tripartite-type tricarboxylate transporter receptor subunit TctC